MMDIDNRTKLEGEVFRSRRLPIFNLLYPPWLFLCRITGVDLQINFSSSVLMTNYRIPVFWIGTYRELLSSNTQVISHCWCCHSGFKLCRHFLQFSNYDMNMIKYYNDFWKIVSFYGEILFVTWIVFSIKEIYLKYV